MAKTKQRVFELPPIQEELATRRKVARLLETLKRSIYLEARVDEVKFGYSPVSFVPRFTLRLVVKPPIEPADLVPFDMFVTRAFIAPLTPKSPFYFEEALGHINLPWGKPVTEARMIKYFAPWVGRKVIAQIGLVEYQGTMRMRVEDLLPEDTYEEVTNG